MKKTIILIGMLCVSISMAQGEKKLIDELSPLQFLAGWCWAGTFSDGIKVDTHCFESIYGGNHVRDRHIVSGEQTLYGGETIYSWNSDDQSIGYIYWTSTGGISQGTLDLREGRYVFPDETYIGSNGEKIEISSSWENISETSYDLLIKETVIGGTADETRMTFKRQSYEQLAADW